jgi:putative SOS response-associated peptidase YedK
MCLNFLPTQNRTWIEEHFHISLPAVFRDEIYPEYDCPIIRGAFDTGQHSRHTYNIKSESMTADHVPEWHRETYNARSETVATKPSFRAAWNHRHYALVIVDGFMQPNYETGSAVRWLVHKSDGSPFAIACLWERWTNIEKSEDVISFCILTRDASKHPLLNRFHKSGDAKRMPVIIANVYLHSWLEANLKHASELISMDAPLDLVAEPFPRAIKA